jgi:hypothetical protein
MPHPHVRERSSTGGSRGVALLGFFLALLLAGGAGRAFGAPAEKDVGAPFPLPRLNISQLRLEGADVTRGAAAPDDTFGRGPTAERVVVVATWCSACHAFLQRMSKDATIRAAFRHVLLLDSDNLSAIGLLQSHGQLSADAAQQKAAAERNKLLYLPSVVSEMRPISFELVESDPLLDLVNEVPFGMRCANGTCQHFNVPEWGLE